MSVEAYGVGIAVTCEPGSVLDQMREILPPGWRECGEAAVQARFTLVGDESVGYGVRAGEALLASGVEREVALGVLDARIRAEIATRATDWIFVHAGVVAVGGCALVIPGASFSGKTTLVRALIEAGATYFSDEYAVLDRDGHVHPYPKPLSIRNGGSITEEISAGTLGALTSAKPADIAVVVITSYRPGASWQPKRYSAANAALALFSHTVPARERPREVMAVVSRATANACLLEGERGEAETTASALLQVHPANG